MKRDHSKLAPVLFDYVPKGRDDTAKAMYKVMRWMARKNREENYQAIRKALLDVTLFGQSIVRIPWKKL